jgi:hypothetical protein
MDLSMVGYHYLVRSVVLHCIHVNLVADLRYIFLLSVLYQCIYSSSAFLPVSSTGIYGRWRTLCWQL